jgi:hypothetical protein
MWCIPQQQVFFTQQLCLKRLPNTNNYYPSNPKSQIKPKTKDKKQTPKSFGAQLSNYNNQRKKKFQNELTQTLKGR